MTIPEEQRDSLYEDEEVPAEGDPTEGRVPGGSNRPREPHSRLQYRQRREFRDFVPASRKQIRKSLSSRARYSNMDAFIDRLKDKRKTSSLNNLRNSTMGLVNYT